jgi:protein-S-isoprenylcysteine O-methyltransferase Ste14
MKLDGVLSVVVAALTLFSFSRGIRWFRRAKETNPAKTALTLSATACAVIQLAVIAVAPSPGLVFRCLGIALYVLAQGLFWWARSAHGGERPAFAFIATKPAFLTQTGPYRFIRHPFYTAYLLVWLAGAVVSAQPWLLLTTVGMTAFHYVAARQEEQSFAQTDLAGAYRNYKQRTGMFFPNPLGLLRK